MAAMDRPDRLDPRQRRTRAKVLAAAREVLRRDGLRGATIDAIAAEAGVARSTVYRNWETREDVLAAAFDDAIQAPTAVDGSRPLRDQLQQVLVGLSTALSRSEWGRTLPAVVAAIAAEPDLAGRYGRLTEERRVALAVIVNRGVERGELPRGVIVDDLIDALVGPLFYRRLVRQVSTGAPWISRHVDRTLQAFGAPIGDGQRRRNGRLGAKS
jgi:AcrR family transcriptional regulator